MAEADDLRLALKSNASAISRYTRILNEDAIDPKPGYSLDGETVNRDQWREGIAAILDKLMEQRRKLKLLIRRTVSGFWLGRPPSEQTAYEDRD
jgi:hypothetical protein